MNCQLLIDLNVYVKICIYLHAYYCVENAKLLAKKAPTRFELVTSSLLDWRSNQLSYGAKVTKKCF